MRFFPDPGGPFEQLMGKGITPPGEELMSVASWILYVLDAFELAASGIYRKKTKALRRGLAAMKALKAWCRAALDLATPS